MTDKSEFSEQDPSISGINKQIEGGAGPNAPSASESTTPTKGKHFKTKPMTFLGMHLDAPEAEKLWQAVIQSVNSALGHYKDKMIQAMKQMSEDNDS